MKTEETPLSGIFLINCEFFEDQRGSFTKTFQKEAFQQFKHINVEFTESFYSISKRDVIRGMHFQIPPHQHAKLTYVVSGEILDVVVDLRKSSPSYGEFFLTKLSDKNRKAIYISPGFAHGFKTISEEAIVIYLTTKSYAREHDQGIHYNSFGMDWSVIKPTISQRDQNFVTLHEFKSPF